MTTPTSSTPTAMGLAFALVVFATSTVGACSNLQDLASFTCGNFVVEPGEDCDDPLTDSKAPSRPFVSSVKTGNGLPARCAKANEADACDYVADAPHGCPVGFVVSTSPTSRRCVRPSGTFGLPSAAIADMQGSSPQVADIDGDGQLDVMLDGVAGSVPYYFTRTSGRYAVTPGPSELAKTALVDLTGDRIPDGAAVDPTFAGLSVRKRHPDRTDEAVLYAQADHLGDLRYAWAPAATVPATISSRSGRTPTATEERVPAARGTPPAVGAPCAPAYKATTPAGTSSRSLG